jgi:cytochrome c
MSFRGPLAVTLALLLAPAPALASAELVRSKNCVACHHPERKMIGPSWNAIAVRHADDQAAVRTLGEKVVAGGSGAWGPMPMPPQAVSQAEAEALVAWILTQR